MKRGVNMQKKMILPCNIGDKVWVTTGKKTRTGKVSQYRITEDSYDVGIELEGGVGLSWFQGSDFGSIIFLSSVIENLLNKIPEESVSEIEEFLGYPISADILEDIDSHLRKALSQMSGKEVKKWINHAEKDIQKVAVTWEMCGYVDIEADSMEEAMEKVKEDMDHIKLPDNGEYVDGSFCLSSEDVDEMVMMGRVLKN